MPRGVFLSFEGSEGCGKSTQIQLLAESLRRLGQRVVLTREPGGTEIGEHLRHLLQHSPAGHAMTPEAELLLFTASRAQLVREVIQPALVDGACVLSDRFLDSTTVYQGVARRLAADDVAAVNRFAVGDTLPDLTFVLDLDSETSRARLLQRAGAPDRMESQGTAFYESVRAGYLALARANPERIRLIDAAAPVATVAARIWEEVATRLQILV